MQLDWKPYEALSWIALMSAILTLANVSWGNVLEFFFLPEENVATYISDCLQVYTARKASSSFFNVLEVVSFYKIYVCWKIQPSLLKQQSRQSLPFLHMKLIWVPSVV